MMDVPKSVTDDLARKIYDMVRADNGIRMYRLVENTGASKSAVRHRCYMMAANGLLRIQQDRHYMAVYANNS